MLGSAKMASGQPLPELLNSSTLDGNWPRSTISNFTRLASSAWVDVHRSAMGFRAASIHTVMGAVSLYGFAVAAGADVTLTWTVWMIVCGVGEAQAPSATLSTSTSPKAVDKCRFMNSPPVTASEMNVATQKMARQIYWVLHLLLSCRDAPVGRLTPWGLIRIWCPPFTPALKPLALVLKPLARASLRRVRPAPRLRQRAWDSGL